MNQLVFVLNGANLNLLGKRQDPLALRVRNLCGVIQGREARVVSGREGLNTLKVIAAAKQSAATGTTVALA